MVHLAVITGSRVEIMIKVTKCMACDGSGKENTPPGIYKKCHYCRGTGWVEYREIIHAGK
jgi:DnaJ-class molecular chaperone